jgi:1-acyl-sn-glycerol-3-phosphate acyltransferase
VAQLRGVEVLNINELANSLKPVVLPGEIMKVFILKEGKEYNQGVAYLDDGTMVVVDNARRMIGKTIDVVVTSVLQTTAGKMIFGRFIDSAAQQPGRAGGEPRRVPRGRGGAPHREDDASAVGRRPPGSDRAHSARPLVAHGLLPHPGDLGLHDRPRHALDRLEPVRAPRALRALVRAHVVAADPGTTGVRVEVEGLERLEPGRTYVFVANHQSIYDIPILFWSLPYQVRIMAKASLGRFPFLGWHLRRAGHMLVDRRRPDRRVFSWGKALAEQGLSLIVFPEGTRSPDGRVARFKGGSFYVALEAGLPIVPVSVVGSRHVMLKGRLR